MSETPLPSADNPAAAGQAGLRVGPLADLAPDAATKVTVDGHRLAVVRLGDDTYIIGDRCSHADFSLAEGELDAAEKTLECWKHGSAFSLETGEPDCLPATKPVPTYEAQVVDGVLFAVPSEAQEEQS